MSVLSCLSAHRGDGAQQWPLGNVNKSNSSSSSGGMPSEVLPNRRPRIQSPSVGTDAVKSPEILTTSTSINFGISLPHLCMHSLDDSVARQLLVDQAFLAYESPRAKHPRRVFRALRG